MPPTKPCKPTLGLPRLCGLSVLALAVMGCPQESHDATASSSPGVAAGASGTAPVTTAASGASAAAAPTGTTDYAHANELGSIPVMEYHRFGPKEERWTRTPANFRKDLEFFYNNNYVTVTAGDLAEGKLALPAGKKPVVFTFDDATDAQFRYLKGADGKPDPKQIDPDCVVGMMDAFYAKHPDFGRAATFYVLPSGFEQDGVIKEKLQYLKATGREVGNHTWSHDNMSKMSVQQVTTEITKDQHFIHQHLGDDYVVRTLALPFGIAPKADDAFKAVSNGGSGADAYHFKALFLVGANPNVSPYDKKYKATGVARIQGIDSEYKNWFNRKAGDTGKVREPWVPFVSDGDPTKLTFPKAIAEKLNAAALPAGVTANPFDPAAAAASAAPADHAASSTPLPGASGSPLTPPSPVPVGADSIPGYASKLPAGGTYANGRIAYTVKSGDSVEDIAWKFVKYTDYYTYNSLVKGIRAENKFKGNDLTVGATLYIPKARAQAPRAERVARDKSFEAKGIYITGTVAGSEEIWDLVRDLKAKGGNTVVFDAKDMNGVITYKSEVPLAKEIHAYKGDMITDMPKLIERLHQQGIHVVARVAQFHDVLLVQHKPELALKSKKSGGAWREAGDLVWVDASRPAVQDYNLALAKELVAKGVDEIQLDYVRFPAMGETHDISWSTIATQKEKKDVITAYVKRVHDELAPSKALLSADVYGVVGWDQGIDVRITGQKIEELGPHLDAISPMLYPSHFYADFDHFSYPPDHPDYFISEGVKKFLRRTAGSGVTVRPWLQAFPFRIHNYGPQYVAVQLEANQGAKANGWLLWNAGNDYKVGFEGVDLAQKHGPLIVQGSASPKPPSPKPAASVRSAASASPHP